MKKGNGKAFALPFFVAAGFWLTVYFSFLEKHINVFKAFEFWENFIVFLERINKKKELFFKIVLFKMIKSGDDGGRTRVQKFIPCTSTIIVNYFKVLPLFQLISSN